MFTPTNACTRRCRYTKTVGDRLCPVFPSTDVFSKTYLVKCFGFVQHLPQTIAPQTKTHHLATLQQHLSDGFCCSLTKAVVKMVSCFLLVVFLGEASCCSCNIILCPFLFHRLIRYQIVPPKSKIVKDPKPESRIYYCLMTLSILFQLSRQRDHPKDCRVGEEPNPLLDDQRLPL